VIRGNEFVDCLRANGFDKVVGVPCSYFGEAFEAMERDDMYHSLSHEGLALSYAVGRSATGRPTAMLLQNSGLGNLINPLTSLVLPYRTPLLAFMSLRGWPDPDADEPQHAVMGARAMDLLRAVDTKFVVLEPEPGALDCAVAEAVKWCDAREPYFVLVPKGVFAPASPPAVDGRGDLLDRDAAIRTLADVVGDLPIVASTGHNSRALYAATDRPTHFYMQGSMGHTAAFALGVVAGLDEWVVVLDGDGSALMHLSAMVDVGAARPVRLLHVVLDNAVFESTGAQPTSSSRIDLAAIAKGAGYAGARAVSGEAEFRAAIKTALQAPLGPQLIVVATESDRREVLPRVSGSLSQPDLHERFSAAVRPKRTARTASRGRFTDMRARITGR